MAWPSNYRSQTGNNSWHVVSCTLCEDNSWHVVSYNFTWRQQLTCHVWKFYVRTTADMSCQKQNMRGQQVTCHIFLFHMNTTADMSCHIMLMLCEDNHSEPKPWYTSTEFTHIARSTWPEASVCLKNEWRSRVHGPWQLSPTRTQGQDQDHKPPMSHLATMQHDETNSADQCNEYITRDS